jgi:hypothetical protein
MSAFGLDDGNSSHLLKSTSVFEIVGTATTLVGLRLGEL